MWDYHSLHLKIAGGMAVVASGKDIRTLLDETLAEVRWLFCWGFGSTHQSRLATHPFHSAKL